MLNLGSVVAEWLKFGAGDQKVLSSCDLSLQVRCSWCN